MQNGETEECVGVNKFGKLGELTNTAKETRLCPAEINFPCTEICNQYLSRGNP